MTFGTVRTATTTLSNGQQNYYSNRLYTVTATTGDAKTGSSAPVHLSGSAANGNVTLAFAGERAQATASLKYGAGYSSLPTVTIGGTGGTGASI